MRFDVECVIKEESKAYKLFMLRPTEVKWNEITHGNNVIK
jgi:hypothetical protein